MDVRLGVVTVGSLTDSLTFFPISATSCQDFFFFNIMLKDVVTPYTHISEASRYILYYNTNF